VIALVWTPVLNHYHVPTPSLSQAVIDQARYSPADSVFEQLARFNYGLDIDRGSEGALIDAAEDVLEGIVRLPWLEPQHVVIPFSPDDIDHPQLGLYLCSLGPANTLIRAYAISQREEFLRLARDIIVAWARYERAAWLPRGLLWNDHTIANRVLVLARFWHIYRQHDLFEPSVAKVILEFAARSGHMLAKPTHYTFATNHGIMQNLALWHARLGFPTLPSTATYANLALDRMRQQMEYYINSEGVVLEHSAGYHEWGLALLAMTFDYLKLLGQDIPDQWLRKYAMAEDFYHQILRPDSTLPRFGDTRSRAEPLVPLAALRDSKRAREVGLPSTDRIRGPRSHSLYAVAGYSIWWDGLDGWPAARDLRQTVVLWSQLRGHGHKHADELSVLVWAGGRTWWTNVGYWGYGVPGRAAAVSWSGSNAPHLIGEPADSRRTTTLLGHGWSEQLAAIDLRRDTESAHRFRRQVVYVRPDKWVILDHVAGSKGARARTVWTTWYDTELSSASAGTSFVLTDPDRSSHMRVTLVGSQGTRVRSLEGSLDPFAGWVAESFAGRPAPALVVEQPAEDSWAATICSLEEGAAVRSTHADREVVSWTRANRWEIHIAASDDELLLSRAGNLLRLSSDGKVLEELELHSAPDTRKRKRELEAALDRMAVIYPQFASMLDFRRKLSYLLLGIFCAQETLLVGFGRFLRQYRDPLRLLAVSGWIAGWVWLNLFYL
jgi:hypothetical protein